MDRTSASWASVFADRLGSPFAKIYTTSLILLNSRVLVTLLFNGDSIKIGGSNVSKSDYLLNIWPLGEYQENLSSDWRLVLLSKAAFLISGLIGVLFYYIVISKISTFFYGMDLSIRDRRRSMKNKKEVDRIREEKRIAADSSEIEKNRLSEASARLDMKKAEQQMNVSKYPQYFEEFFHYDTKAIISLERAYHFYEHAKERHGGEPLSCGLFSLKDYEQDLQMAFNKRLLDKGRSSFNEEEVLVLTDKGSLYYAYYDSEIIKGVMAAEGKVE